MSKIPESENEKGQDYVIFPRDRYSEVLEHAYYEILRAREKHGKKDFASAHEGYGVLIEEVEEAFDEIKGDNVDKAREEMVQVAAMATRFVAEL